MINKHLSLLYIYYKHLRHVQFKLFINGLEEEMERMLIKLQVIENKIGYFRRQNKIQNDHDGWDKYA